MWIREWGSKAVGAEAGGWLGRRGGQLRRRGAWQRDTLGLEDPARVGVAKRDEVSERIVRGRSEWVRKGTDLVRRVCSLSKKDDRPSLILCQAELAKKESHSESLVDAQDRQETSNGQLRARRASSLPTSTHALTHRTIHSHTASSYPSLSLPSQSTRPPSSGPQRPRSPSQACTRTPASLPSRSTQTTGSSSSDP